MIYLKRFCFAVTMFLCILIGSFGTIVELATYPIWGLICYVITGNDRLDPYGLSLSWKYSMKFMDWYDNKFGPNDD